MYMYVGLEDPSRVSRNVLGPVEVWHYLNILAGLSPEKIPMEVVLEPFHAGTNQAR